MFKPAISKKKNSVDSKFQPRTKKNTTFAFLRICVKCLNVGQIISVGLDPFRSLAKLDVYKNIFTQKTLISRYSILNL